MNEYEFLAWVLGILFVGLPAVFIGIPCLTAIIITWMEGR